MAKLWKVFVSFMLKQVSHSLFPRNDDVFSLTKGYTFAWTKWFLSWKPDRNDTNWVGANICLTCSSACK